MLQAGLGSRRHLAATLAVRPPRLALLVPAVKGVSWLAMFEAALAAQTAFWGGQGNIVFPQAEDFTDNELLWELGDRFDADAFVSYAPTWSEWAEIAPAEHRRVMDKLHRDAAKRSTTKAADEFVANQAKETALWRRLTEPQAKLLVHRLAPLHENGDPALLHHYNGVTRAPWPLVDVRKFRELPREIRQPRAPTGAARKLALTASVGRVGAAFREQLDEHEIVVHDEDLTSGWQWADAAVDRRQAQRPDNPWALSEVGLGRYQRGLMLSTPGALVAGNTPWDFSLFYALRRMSGLAWWLPTWLERDQAYMSMLASAIEYDPERRDVAVVSASSAKACARVAKSIKTITGRQVTLAVADWREVLPDQPIRRFEVDNAGSRYRQFEVIDGATLPLETPLPRQISTEIPTDTFWMAELQARDWAPGRDGRLPKALLTELLHGSETTRTTRDGVAYFCPNVMTFVGQSLEAAVVRPMLHPLDVVEQVQHVLADAGWKAELSDKGIYARESMQLFGGFDGLVAAFRDPSTRPLMDTFLAKEGPGRRLSSDNRRYLTWANFTKVASGFDPRDSLHDLLRRGVLTRGIVLRCRRCRQNAWHEIAAVGEEFTCGRCRITQATERDSWGDNDEPVWSYQLAEVVYQLLDNNGHLPLLAVNDQVKRPERPFQHGYELDVTNPGGDSKEVDIFALDGSRLWIGEATTKGRFDPGKMDFLSRLADATRAYGVLLATSKSHFAPATTQEIDDAFPGAWPRLARATGVPLGPPPDATS